VDILVAIGRRDKVASKSAYVACGLSAQDHIASFLICDCCARAEEIATPMGGLVRQLSSERGFAASQVTLEVRGRCADCQT
jgi:Fur family zinc uptake transcriptional regulator